MTALRKERDLALEGLLTPDELAVNQTNTYAATPEFASQYGNSAPTSAELVGIYGYNERLDRLASENDPDAAQQEMRAELLKYMSPERIQQFMLFQHPTYRETVALANRFGLQNDAVDKLIALKVESLTGAYTLECAI